ncbi:hypothetical protein ACIOEZ_34135 [Streptomyces sp. NPDC087866]|uniref:hypothetical protein n=1 Tax=Streptomyces sp. NPDC087866 TaxID=3365815 RepID=UPI00380246BB
MTDPKTARETLVDHKYYRYRGCAPDPDRRGMATAGGLAGVSLDVWGPYTGDGAEEQKTRLDRERLAQYICHRCPVLAACRTYANSTVVDADGVEHLVEPEGVMGGEKALSRHRALIARRHDATVSTSTAGEGAASVEPAPVVRDLKNARTAQKLAVLYALARETDPDAVAYRAGMDVRTANWHRSALTDLLGLDREQATRDQLLTAAKEAGLIRRSTRVRDGGRWPVAAAPTTDGVRQRRIAPGAPTQLLLPGTETLPRSLRVLAGPPVPERVPVPRPRAAAGPVQLELPLGLPAAARPATPALFSVARSPRAVPAHAPTAVLEPAA